MSKVILITGGGRGIGAATALLAASEDYDVCVNYTRDAASAADVVAQCRAAGASAMSVQADVRDEQQVIELFEETEAELGPLTCVVNNAGILHTQARVDEFTIERLREVVDVNIIGAFLVAREAVRRMSTKHGGSGGTIVNVSSAASYLGSANEFVDYAATKGAMDTMTIGLSKEVAAEGIRVNAVRPGLIDTEIHASSGEAGRVKRLAPNIPMLRGGRADEVAAAILYLASDASSYVNGALLNVSGGR